LTVAERAAQALSLNTPGGMAMAVGYVAAAAVGGLAFITLLALVLIYAERKIAAHFQCRLGPMRVGWHGTLQSLADAIKLLFKEDVIPAKGDRLLHGLAPCISVMAMMLTLAFIPFSANIQVLDLNVGVLFVAAVSSIGVLGVLLAGWASHNKWSLIGSMRAGAQIISYELSATLALLVVVLFSGTMSLRGIVLAQAEGWWIFKGHVPAIAAFAVFMIASVAELNRTPFDLAEGESELGAGFHTEYSGLRFSMFFLAEFINMFLVSAIMATLFLGGWMPLYISGLDGFNQVMALLPGGMWFALKTGGIVFFIMWLRWTFPRMRVDQMMKLEWKFLMPVSFANLLLAAVVVALCRG